MFHENKLYILVRFSLILCVYKEYLQNEIQTDCLCKSLNFNHQLKFLYMFENFFLSRFSTCIINEKYKIIQCINGCACIFALIATRQMSLSRYCVVIYCDYIYIFIMFMWKYMSCSLQITKFTWKPKGKPVKL